MALVHGGDWAGYQQEYGAMPLDFSANISPLGLPAGVAAAITAALPHADRYPDPLCRELRAALAQHHRVGPEQILCGNGAADLIFRLALAYRPKQALVTAPTFAEYEQALAQVNCTIEHFILQAEKDFAVTDAILPKLVPGLDVVFLCEPNNPTGKTTDPALLREILRICEKNKILLVVDECFNDFLEEPEQHTLLSELRHRKNLVILKAFTKQYAMAGVRLGYVLSANAGLLEKMRSAGQPWAVSTLAQAAGLAALQETAYTEELHQLICTQRRRMMNELQTMGLKVCPGQANYLLFYAKETELPQKLRKKGILLRDCSNYIGLEQGWYRAAVRTEEENTRFLAALKEVLANG